MSRVALTFFGDGRRRSAWSGSTRSLSDALEGIGVEVAHVSAEPSRAETRLVRFAARAGRPIDEVGVASRTLARRLRRAGPVDAAIQIGTEFEMPRTSFPLATYEDMTVAQARRLDHPLLRGIDDHGLDAWIERQRATYERAAACCTITRWAADSIVEDYGIPESRVHVVGVGRNLQPRAAERDWSAPRFLFVGQDWKRKNGPAIVDAFRTVRARVPKATLTLVGGVPHIDEPGIHVHERLFLNRPEQRRRLEELFEAATCFLMPSTIEPSGIAILEAAVAGVPTIGTTVGGTVDIVGDCGRLVDPMDGKALVDAMLELCDGKLAQRLGSRARERAEWFTWPKTAARIATALYLETGGRR